MTFLTNFIFNNRTWIFKGNENYRVLGETGETCPAQAGHHLIIKLNEQHRLQESLARSHAGNRAMARRYRENADAAKEDMRLLHEILGRL